MSAPTAAATLLRLAARGTARRRLFCLPFAGGGAAAYRLWPRTLPDDVEVLAVQLPGREGRIREQPIDTIAGFVAATLPTIAAHADLPYAIFGHSMGALVAFELALALEASTHRPPSHLFVSSRRAPDEPDHEVPVNGLPDEQFLDELQSRYGGVPEAVRKEPELLELLLPLLRADIRAIERYAPQAGRMVRCPVDVYGGIDDVHPAPVQLAGWQRVAAQPVRVRLFAGDHFYLAAQRDALTADIAARWHQSAAREACA